MGDARLELAPPSLSSWCRRHDARQLSTRNPCKPSRSELAAAYRTAWLHNRFPECLCRVRAVGSAISGGSLAVPSRGHRTAVSPSCSKAAGEQFSPSGTRHRARCRCGRSTYRRTRAVATRSCRSWVPRVLAWRIVSRGDAGQGSRRRRRTAAARSRSPSRSSRRRVSGDPCAESKPGYVLVKASGTTGGT